MQKLFTTVLAVAMSIPAWSEVYPVTESELAAPLKVEPTLTLKDAPAVFYDRWMSAPAEESAPVTLDELLTYEICFYTNLQTGYYSTMQNIYEKTGENTFNINYWTGNPYDQPIKCTFNPEEQIVEIPLGQKVWNGGGYYDLDFYFVMCDVENNFKPIFDGVLVLDVANGCMATNEAVGIYITGPNNPSDLKGWMSGEGGLVMRAPNATLKYTRTFPEMSGLSYNIDNKIYAEVYKNEAGKEVLSVSSVYPISNGGKVVEFELDGDKGVAENQISYPDTFGENNENPFVVCTIDTVSVGMGEQKIVFTPKVNGEFNADHSQFVFGSAKKWTIAQIKDKSGYIGVCTPGIITFGAEKKTLKFEDIADLNVRTGMNLDYNLRQSGICSFSKKEDGSIEIFSLFGYGDKIQANINEKTGTLDLVLGQVTGTYYDSYLAIQDGENIIQEGTASMKFEDGRLYYKGNLGLYVPAYKAWLAPYENIEVNEGNARIQYRRQMSGVSSAVDNLIYANQFLGQDMALHLTLSNVAPMNDGFEIDFILSGKNGVATEQIGALDPVFGNQLLFSTWTLNEMTGQYSYTPTVEGQFIDNDTKFTWGHWALYDTKTKKTSYGICDDAVVILDLSSAIDDVIIRENDTQFDPAAPVEYYNLQGMRVAHPQRGMIYVARQGDKSTKIVF